uniref:IPT/TIG domain-containing protein n=1 Tax=Parastrongyloides trichosuri TaxID=131310 RepID=A0A0N4ZFS2_PARTI
MDQTQHSLTCINHEICINNTPIQDPVIPFSNCDEYYGTSGGEISFPPVSSQILEEISVPNFPSPINLSSPQHSDDTSVDAREQSLRLQFIETYKNIKRLNEKMTNFQIPKSLTKKDMREYLSKIKEYECTLNFRSITVLQKSYGKEKRFLFPPPILELINRTGWRKFKNEVKKFNKFHGLSENATNDDEIHTSCPSKLIGVAVYRGSFKRDNDVIEFDEALNIASLKRIYFTHNSNEASSYIGEGFRKKHKYSISRIDAKLYFSCGIDIGSISTDDITIISKRCQGKSSCVRKDSENLFILGGLKVALYGRMRGTSFQPKYINFENDSFISSINKWKCLEIQIIDEEETNIYSDTSEIFTTSNNYLRYGDVIKIIDPKSRISLPFLRILIADTNIILSDYHVNSTRKKEYISQLSKVALQFVNDPKKFISLSGDIITGKASTLVEENTYQIDETCALQIALAKEKEISFCCAKGLTPVPFIDGPIVDDVTECGSNENYRIELTGSGFNPFHEVWIGDEKIETFMKSSKNMVAVPSIGQYTKFKNLSYAFHSDKLSIFIVRIDGVIYNTDFSICIK